MGRLRLHVGARIRWKILGPYLVLSLLLAALATVLVTRVVSGSLEERFVNQLAESARVTSDAIVRREQQHLETIRAASFTQGIVEAARNADSQEAEAIVVPIAANSGTETIAVFEADGSLVFGAQRTEEGTRTSYVTIPATDLAATADLLEAVLSGRTDNLGDKFASLVETAAGPSLVTAGPIYEGETIVGAVMVGTTLNSFLPEIKQQALADVSLYTSTGDPIATTFVTDADSILQSAPIGELAPGGASPRRTHSMAGRPYQFLFTQMFIRGEPIGTLSVALPTTFITNADATTRNQMAVLFGFATIAVLAVGVLLARLLTRPIARLVDVATAVTSGDLTVRSGIDSSDEIGTLAHTFDAMTERLQRQHLGTVRALVTAIEARDPYTRGHSVRVGHLSVELGAAIGLSESQLQHLQIGGYLHDIGKIGIRDDILLKPGALSAEERLLIEEHPRVGLEILETVDLPSEVLAVVGQHHERLDGTGYPLKLSAEELTIFPRVAAVADVYDALTTDRPYRAGMEIVDALSILGREVESGMLDPEIVSAMIREAARWEERIHDDPMLTAESSGDLIIRGTSHHPHPRHHPHAAA